jgi:hypothetical protein
MSPGRGRSCGHTGRTQGSDRAGSGPRCRCSHSPPVPGSVGVCADSSVGPSHHSRHQVQRLRRDESQRLAGMGCRRATVRSRCSKRRSHHLRR